MCDSKIGCPPPSSKFKYWYTCSVVHNNFHTYYNLKKKLAAVCIMDIPFEINLYRRGKVLEVLNGCYKTPRPQSADHINLFINATPSISLSIVQRHAPDQLIRQHHTPTHHIHQCYSSYQLISQHHRPNQLISQRHAPDQLIHQRHAQSPYLSTLRP